LTYTPPVENGCIAPQNARAQGMSSRRQRSTVTAARG
jgi:hypothetical protein